MRNDLHEWQWRGARCERIGWTRCLPEQEAEDDQRNCCTPENGSADAAHVVRGDEELCLCAGMVWAENQSNYVRRVTEEGNVVERCGWGWTGNLHWHARDVAGSSLGAEALEPSFQYLPPCWLTVN